MMAQTGSFGQPLLIPLSMGGSIGGQGGLAVLTLPTTSVATLPALAAANAAGNLLKLPFAGLQGKTRYVRWWISSCYVVAVPLLLLVSKR